MLAAVGELLAETGYVRGKVQLFSDTELKVAYFRTCRWEFYGAAAVLCEFDTL